MAFLGKPFILEYYSTKSNTMHPYLPYLLEDIKNAERISEEAPAEHYPETIEEELEAAEDWVSGGSLNHTFGYYCGLRREDFPPVEQFSEEDIRKTFRAFGHLLFTWNADLDLPEELPWTLRYKFMINILNEKFTLMESGFLVFDFCSGYAPGCVFGKYCGCKKFWDKKE